MKNYLRLDMQTVVHVKIYERYMKTIEYTSMARSSLLLNVSGNRHCCIGRCSSKYHTMVAMVFYEYIWKHIIIAVLPEPPGLILPHVAPTLGFFFILSRSSCRASGENSTSPSSAMTYVFSAYIMREVFK